MQIDFKFSPLEKVRVVAYGLNCDGRIQKCEWNGHTKNYNVEFCMDGKIDTRMFYEDELE